MSPQSKPIYEFGPYRLDAAERVLSRDREVIPLQPKVFDLLAALVERSGRLLEKDELMKLIWPDTVVEEVNLANNISILRKTVGENVQPFIETVPKRGYRFVASVNKVEDEHTESAIPGQRVSQSTLSEGEQAANVGDGIPSNPALNAESEVSKPRHYLRGALSALTALVLTGGSLAYFVLNSSLPPKVTATTQITKDGLTKAQGALVTDGSRLYFTEATSEGGRIAQVSVNGGETFAIHVEPHCILDLSPNGSELLVLSRGVVERTLWVLPVLSDVPRRVGNVISHDATWSLDGQHIVYANGSALYLAKSDGTESRKLVTVPGTPYWPRWSPDGSRLRFTVRNGNLSSSNSLWEVSADGSNSHPLLPGWNEPADECCGNWTVDGRYFVFQSTRHGATSIWARRERAGLLRRGSQEPVQLTVGPMNYRVPVPSQDGKRLFVVGEVRRGELSRYDTKTNQWSSYLSGISASGLDFSRDGAWVVYTTYPEGDLWRSKIDGSQRLQLTFPPMQAALSRWTPDGKQIAFTARVPGKRWKTYLISAEGGTPQQLMPEERNELDPGWSPDGKTLVFGDFDAKTIRLFDLSTRQVSMLPGSEGLCSPRWSPDGRYIATIPFGSFNKLLLFDFTTQEWRELAQQPGTSWPHWSRDGKYIYFHSRSQGGPALFRVRIGDRKIDRIASAKKFRPVSDILWGSWQGWAPDDSPLVLRDGGIQDIYALEWQTP